MQNYATFIHVAPPMKPVFNITEVPQETLSTLKSSKTKDVFQWDYFFFFKNNTNYFSTPIAHLVNLSIKLQYSPKHGSLHLLSLSLGHKTQLM